VNSLLSSNQELINMTQRTFIDNFVVFALSFFAEPMQGRLTADEARKLILYYDMLLQNKASEKFNSPPKVLVSGNFRFFISLILSISFSISFFTSSSISFFTHRPPQAYSSSDSICTTTSSHSHLASLSSLVSISLVAWKRLTWPRTPLHALSLSM
jgi:hypothetical protein